MLVLEGVNIKKFFSAFLAVILMFCGVSNSYATIWTYSDCEAFIKGRSYYCCKSEDKLKVLTEKYITLKSYRKYVENVKVLIYPEGLATIDEETLAAWKSCGGDLFVFIANLITMEQVFLQLRRQTVDEMMDRGRIYYG